MCWYTRYGSIQLSTYCTDSWSVDRYGPVRRTMLLIKVLSKVMLGIPLLEGTNPASCFPQIVIGSEAVCYSYIWSEKKQKKKREEEETLEISSLDPSRDPSPAGDLFSPCGEKKRLLVRGEGTRRRSSFSQKDALTPLAPYASPPLLLPLPAGSTLPRGSHPCGRHRCPCWRQVWPRAAAPCGRPAAGPLYGRRTASGCAREWLPHMRAAAPASGASLPCRLALAAANRPLIGGLGRGWPPLLLAAFAAKTQQKHVERFYAIQSHHTQFNLSYENFSSDTAVGKPPRVHHMHDGPRSSLGIGRVRTMRWNLVGSSLGDSPKGSGSSLGTRERSPKEDHRTHRKDAEGCQIRQELTLV
ncbi:hypothetical protein GW17_00034490 [Ensete ventricosum]|nr:hypothetical protein GW17_00034490 [Ensete ventricosum]